MGRLFCRRGLRPREALTWNIGLQSGAKLHPTTKSGSSGKVVVGGPSGPEVVPPGRLASIGSRAPSYNKKMGFGQIVVGGTPGPEVVPPGRLASIGSRAPSYNKNRKLWAGCFVGGASGPEVVPPGRLASIGSRAPSYDNSYFYPKSPRQENHHDFQVKSLFRKTESSNSLTPSVKVKSPSSVLDAIQR